MENINQLLWDKPASGRSLFFIKRMPRKKKKALKKVYARLLKARKQGVALTVINQHPSHLKWPLHFIQKIGRINRNSKKPVNVSQDLN